MSRLAPYGAELMNVALGLLAWLTLTLLAALGFISWHTWRLGVLLAGSFVVLPLPLLLAHRLSPRLARAMEPRPREVAEGEEEATAPGGSAAKPQAKPQ